MTDTTTDREPTATEYADLLIREWRIRQWSDERWTENQRVAFVMKAVIRHLCRPEGINGAPPLEPSDINIDHVRTMVRERLAAVED